MGRATLTTPEGEIIARDVWGDHASSAFSSAECNLNIGADHVITSDNGTTYHIKSTIGDVAIDLVLQRTVASFRQETGHIFIGDNDEQYLAWFSMVPRGDLSGTITYNGATHSVTGLGYHDHNWGSAKIQDTVKKWWWMRGYVDDIAVVGYDWHFKNTYGGKHIPIYGIVDSTEVIAAYSSDLDTTIEGGSWGLPSDAEGYSINPLDAIPFEIDVDTGSAFDCWVGHDCIRNKFTSVDLIESVDLLALQGVSEDERALLALLSYDPWYLRYRGDMSLTIKDFNGHDYSGTGIAIIEYLDLE